MQKHEASMDRSHKDRVVGSGSGSRDLQVQNGSRARQMLKCVKHRRWMQNSLFSTEWFKGKTNVEMGHVGMFPCACVRRMTECSVGV